METDSVAGTVGSRGRKLWKSMPDETGYKVSCWEERGIWVGEHHEGNSEVIHVCNRM